jgi:hypothetical protein
MEMSKKNFCFHSVNPLCNPENPSPKEEGGFGHDGTTLRLWRISTQGLQDILGERDFTQKGNGD